MEPRARDGERQSRGSFPRVHVLISLKAISQRVDGNKGHLSLSQNSTRRGGGAGWPGDSDRCPSIPSYPRLPPAFRHTGQMPPAALPTSISPYSPAAALARCRRGGRRIPDAFSPTSLPEPRCAPYERLPLRGRDYGAPFLGRGRGREELVVVAPRHSSGPAALRPPLRCGGRGAPTGFCVSIYFSTLTKFFVPVRGTIPLFRHGSWHVVDQVVVTVRGTVTKMWSTYEGASEAAGGHVICQHLRPWRRPIAPGASERVGDGSAPQLPVCSC